MLGVINDADMDVAWIDGFAHSYGIRYSLMGRCIMLHMQIAVILPDIRSVHNVGSIFRTADAAGVEKIYCCGYTPTPMDRFGRVRQDFAKVSLGAEASVPWEHKEDVAEAIEKLKADGWKIFAIEQARNSIPYDRVPKAKLGAGKIALVAGSEVGGVPAAVLRQCDTILEIPMHGAKESLNVSVAFGIVAFSLKQR
jgi:tRNA G18 (ribose-2'-O)-methylase SpoU